MIKHHPTFELLQAFVNGELPASLSAGIAIHADMCEACQDKIAHMTEQVASNTFEETFLDRFIVDEKDDIEDIDSMNFDAMINGMTESDETYIAVAPIEQTMSFKGEKYVLPTVLNRMSLGKTSNIGKLARSRVQLNEGEIHTSLLHIEPGGGVPEHTHKGFELTVLLSGSFHDEHGEYVKGDFIMLDAAHQHNPISTNGCLCYTVANDALHFTQGINKLLNSIGSLIY